MLFTYLTVLLLSFSPLEDQFTLVINDKITYEEGTDVPVVLGVPEKIKVNSKTGIKSIRIKLSDDKSYVWDSGIIEGNTIEIPKGIESSLIIIYVSTEDNTNYVFPLQIHKTTKLDI